MYTKQETSKQRQEFWTAFGRYMKPVLSADGEEIRMEVDSRQAESGSWVWMPFGVW
jgi:hypothetical protein